MENSYIKQHYGDNCYYADTSYKRYARYHMPREINIFTTTNYCPPPTHCCGGWLGNGNFWSGLGIGLGAGLGNLVTGGLNMLCNWLGGGFNFGMSNFGGIGSFGGFGGFGGFGNYAGGYNAGYTAPLSSGTTTGTTQKKSAELETQDTTGADEADATRAGTTPAADAQSSGIDKDYAEINKLSSLSDLPESVDITKKEDVDAYNDKIEEMIKALNDYELADEIMTDENNLQIQNQKGILERLKKDYKPNLTDEELSSAVDGELNTANLEKLSLYSDKLNDTQKATIKPKLEALLAPLKKDDHYMPPTSYEQAKALELLSKIGENIICKVEHYSAASDQFIEGTITNVEKLANGKYSYWVDCKDTGEKIKAQWKFEVQNASTAKIKGVIANGESPEFLARIGMTYDLEDGYYINNNGKVTGSTTQF